MCSNHRILAGGFEDIIVDTDESDEILQRPVQNKDTVKLALSSSQKRYNFIKTNGVVPCLSTYPYMKEADLVWIYFLLDFVWLCFAAF